MAFKFLARWIFFDYINKLGQEGWELVTVTDYASWSFFQKANRVNNADNSACIPSKTFTSKLNPSNLVKHPKSARRGL